jgi:UDP-glucose 4-epimerase
MRSRLTDSTRRVLITGSAGFLGEATLDRVTAIHESLLAVAFDTRQSSGPSGETRHFISVVRDIREPLDDLLADYEIDTVIHLAFILQPQRDTGHVAQAREVNLDSTERLLKACSKAGVSQIVYLSSATVYGAHPGFTKPFAETAAVNPVSGFSYSEQKVEAEKLFMRYGDANPDCAVSILRGCVVMGPEAKNFITDSLGMRLLPAPIGANPEMQFLHVDDYASAIEAILRQRPHGIYNIAGNDTISWREMVQTAGGKTVPMPAALLRGVVDVTWKLGLQRRSPSAGISFIRYPWLVSTEKIRSELGWEAEHSSRFALESWAASRR